MDYQGLKETVIQMLGNMKCQIDIGTFQNDMTNINNKDDVLTLLVHLGYLAYDSSEVKVYIPNEEVRREFIRALKASKYKEITELIKFSD